MLFYTKIRYALAIIFVKTGIYLWRVSSHFSFVANPQLGAGRSYYFYGIYYRVFFRNNHHSGCKHVLPGDLDYAKTSFTGALVVKPL